MSKQIVNSKAAPAPIGPYNQAVKAGNFLFVSGQIALDAESGALLNESVEQETRQVMKNLEAILSEAGYSFTEVVKTSIFLSDMQLFATVNEIYGSYFSDASTYPARETVAVKGLPKNVNVEISMIAYK